MLVGRSSPRAVTPRVGAGIGGGCRSRPRILALRDHRSPVRCRGRYGPGNRGAERCPAGVMARRTWLPRLSPAPRRPPDRAAAVPSLSSLPSLRLGLFAGQPRVGPVRLRMPRSGLPRAGLLRLRVWSGCRAAARRAGASPYAAVGPPRADLLRLRVWSGCRAPASRCLWSAAARSPPAPSPASAVGLCAPGPVSPPAVRPPAPVPCACACACRQAAKPAPCARSFRRGSSVTARAGTAARRSQGTAGGRPASSREPVAALPARTIRPETDDSAPM
ncbi:hypothetical protein QF034_000599 [Streptomyces africanus]|uniref:Uncharacterized protein n=1 Tax=Streptomyces africanus TaxID=231024 RepID=A0ABU0QG53_9ACTN|nr:hypothetical protein [Streptomyces africanus]